MGIVRLILFVIAIGLLLVSVRQFMNGYSDWQRAQIAEEAYRAEIRKLEVERDQLQQRVEMLKSDTLTKERLARKRLGYVKPGELKFKVVKPDVVE
ncbi:MAG: septum formation initiator family protein [Candidatus Poribacteria bacterium]|nr:septum formation initiator family protein [Candidatus Poribacteria bacterium]